MTATISAAPLLREPIRVAPDGPPTVDVVVPVFDEERDLVPGVRRLDRFLDEEFPLPARITIADNASTDATWSLARMLADDLARVRAIRLEEQGRGRALRAAWESSDAPVLAYMDVGGGGAPGAGPGGGSSIASWVQEHGTLVSPSLTGGATVYDLQRAD